MEQESNSNTNKEGLFSKVIRAGKRRTYFFDVRATKSNDYFITITESKKRFNDDGYERHKIYLYKEDFNKFLAAMNDTVNHIKEDLLPEYDFDEFSHEYDEDYDEKEKPSTSSEPKADDAPPTDGEEPKWED